ncbi:MAG: DUF2520 domain-containing protein [Prevotella sp.]|nr:DUF2520 domain-containing protein [Prevotella sp.]MDE6690305.1 DUF2520 domain-containing protein [Prevotella sp.]
MNIVFIGAGRLATNLARALHEKGHCIVAVYSRTIDAARSLCAVVGGYATTDLNALPLEADAFVLAVKDSVLGELIAGLDAGRENQAFFHTAGSVPLSVFGGHRRCGVIYPMQTFSKERQVDFDRIPFFIEGNSQETQDLARQIALTVSSDVHYLSSEDRRHLHLAAVFACNFTNHCYALSAKILEKHGVPFSVMLPLVEETARKVETMHPRDAQTGPAVRYDENIIEMQKRLLADEPTMHDVYELMSKSINQLAND